VKVKTSPYNIADRLRIPEEMLTFLETCIEKADGDVAFSANALGNIASAQWTSKVAKHYGRPESLFQALSGGRSPSFDSYLRVASARTMKLSANVRSEADGS